METSSRCAVPEASEAAWIHATDLDDLWEGEMCAVSLGTVQLVMCNVEGQVFAYADRCPHLASRLSDGRFDGRLITCAAHEWVFDARGGYGVNPAESRLQRYPACVVNDRIFVDIRETAR
jgi:toluene monooxygenase system ferredoxin subunit